MAAIQDSPMKLEPGEVIKCGFFGWFEENHTAATTAADLVFVDKALSLPEALSEQNPNKVAGAVPAASLFSAAPLLDSLELSEKEITGLFGSERREEERMDGRLLSFFTGTSRHVVLKAKELKVLRPHGHMLRTGDGLIPDEASLTSTTWMNGVFHSMVTQGHVSINRFLSTTHSYLSLFRSNGLRLFVELADGWHLLDVPSAYEMTTDECRWIYMHRTGLFAVSSTALVDRHVLTLSIEVLSGDPVRFLVSHHIAINGDDGSDAVPLGYVRDEEGVFVHPVPDCDVGRRFPSGGFRINAVPGTVLEHMGGDELLFPDGRSRNQPFLCIITQPSILIGFNIIGCLISNVSEAVQEPHAVRFWSDITGELCVKPPAGSTWADAAARVGDILPWFVHNALIHYLAPRGLEQYSGGGWGTRDVCQGPVEMLLALGRFAPIRDILIRVFKQQNPDGDWPQWFMFFDRERSIRPGDSHGDIVFWPILALSQYLIASGDTTLLDEVVPFFYPDGEQKAELATLWQHIERAFAVINSRVISGTSLAAYGNGDWNDSLQPLQPAMRENLCSAWTVTLHYQTLTALAAALCRLGQRDSATECGAMAQNVREDFQRLLIVDDIITGCAYFQSDGCIDYLLHPRDRKTGLSYSLLPMIHAIINDLLTPQQAQNHLSLITEHLLGPDGARLFDRPLEYHGGVQKYFQRAESTTFFGRENGLMYTHAHLRYAEALAHYGNAEGFFMALCKACPIGIRTIVSSATLRQANCYYSSSDAAFADRYQAYAEYDKVIKGEVPLDGGWRVYSSGAGIAVRLIMQCFLGLRWGTSTLVVDPVIPKALDGLQVKLNLAGHLYEVTYYIKGAGCGPTSVILNSVALPFTRGANPYRTGGAEIPMVTAQQHLTEGSNQLTVYIG
jgi:cellobiose phosphorylase